MKGIADDELQPRPMYRQALYIHQLPDFISSELLTKAEARAWLAQETGIKLISDPAPEPAKQSEQPIDSSTDHEHLNDTKESVQDK